MMVYKDVLETVMSGEDLSSSEMTALMDKVMEGELTPAQIAGMLVALRIKGETVEEVAAAAASMRSHATLIDPGPGPVIDIVGTGGDCHHTINVSTSAAFVVAGAGGKIAKHGNRSVSSKCGAADVLEELGVNINASPDHVGRCVREVGVGFLFAPAFHGAMKYAIGPRRELGVRTLFNILGPLTNPAKADRMLVGVYKKELLMLYGEALLKLGVKKGMVVHGSDGLDEISICAPTHVVELKDGKLEEYTIAPGDYVKTASGIADIRGGDAVMNAGILRRILSGEERGAYRDVVVLSAAAGLYVAGLAENLKDGVTCANASIDDGKALGKLDELVEFSNNT
jgi:anthranilate phosphoribosyltransferase